MNVDEQLLHMLNDDELTIAMIVQNLRHKLISNNFSIYSFRINITNHKNKNKSLKKYPIIMVVE